MAPKRIITSAFFFAACVLAASVHAECKESTLHLRSVPEIGSMLIRSRFFGFDSAVKRPLTGGEAAYDYSAHIIKDGGLYRLYSGGRWLRPGVPNGDGDHVIQHVSKTGLGGTWRMPHNRPEFWKGSEEGHGDTWFANNYLEPEVVKVKGKYYMYTEVEVDPGSPIDIPGKNAVTGCDRVQLHTSKDGSSWTRWSEKRGVVVEIDDPTHTFLHHQEVVYVPWDKDKKPFWLYMAVDVGGAPTGHWRIRSGDPTTFNWRRKERVEGLAQLGNQIGYAKQAPGGPLFVRITFTPDAD
ncbi:MAG: hypothetical protein Q7T82_01940 [Armatimonadota bacterium]|nr:hypothetical protein [Armatimonadota bacterium]